MTLVINTTPTTTRPASDPLDGSLRRPIPLRATTYLALLAVTAVAVGLRIWHLDALGFNSDEAVYAGQAASLAGNPRYSLFPVFRAHPMLVQALLSPLFASGEADVAGRYAVAALGVATVLAVFLLGRRLYGTGVGLVAALLMAAMPYHVVVTRQVLLDGPMTLLATLALYCFVRYAENQKAAWFAAACGMIGLTMLAKESSIVLLAGVYAFLALTPTIRRPIRAALLGLPFVFLLFAVHPVTQVLAGRPETGRNYLVWQLLRRPNHDVWFYFTTVPVAMGLLAVVAAGAGLVLLRRSRSWRETLLLSWALAPALAFQLWPVKGFQYLLPAAAPVAVLAARALMLSPLPRFLGTRGATLARVVAVALVASSLAIPSWQRVDSTSSASFLAGSGGVPGGRETGHWLAENTPEGSVVLTLGPSMANILQYYGGRRAYGLSVSPNPLHRNPAYDPLPNPDRAMRNNELQYIVWDSFSAARSPHFSETLQTLARRYHGRVVHTEFVDGSSSDGRAMQVPVIVVYEVRP